MITLINPPSPFANEPAMDVNLGLCYVAASLQSKGFTVDGIDFCAIKEDYTKEDYLDHIPLNQEIYGIYCMTVQFKWVKEIIQYIQINNPKGIIFVGGPHATSCPDDFYKLGVGYVINGYGDHAMTNYLLKEDIANNDLIPNRTPFEKYQYKRTLNGEPAKHINTLRGCPYSCYYCDKQCVGKKVIYRPIEIVLKEIDLLMIRYNVRSFVIYDDIFVLDNNRLKTFCKEFVKRNIQWRCWARTDLVDYDKLKRMKDSGLTSITFGVESGDKTVLKRINKRATYFNNLTAMYLCKSLNIPVRCSLMYGNPGECRESLENTIDMIRLSTPDEWNLAVLKPIPGSEFWDNPEKHGLKFDKQAIIDSDYMMLNRFEDNGVGHVLCELDTMSKQELEDLLPWFISELERVSPRRMIQDSLQEIKV